VIAQQVVLFFVAMSLLGCWTTAKHVRKPKPVPSTTALGTGTQGNILNKARLKAGGKVLIVPFSAGERVAETDETEKIAFRLLRGMSEALKDQKVLVLVPGDEAASADFVIRGRIVRLKEKDEFVKFFSRKKVRYLAVEGEMTSRDNDEPMAYFSHSAKNQSANENFGEVAEKLGRDIGRFILDATK